VFSHFYVLVSSVSVGSFFQGKLWQFPVNQAENKYKTITDLTNVFVFKVAQ
jgi:hypothetical protein